MSDDVSELLVQLGTATLGECGATPLRPSIRPVWPGAAFAGPARTAWCADGDNLAVHAALARPAPGAVLAVACDGPGALGEPVRLGGELVGPGDWLVGDDDGVVVIPEGQLALCRDAAAARAEREAGMMARLRDGASTVGLLGLDVGPVRGAR